MEVFCKNCPNLVFGHGHPPVQLHPVLLLQGDPRPDTGILLLWLCGSLVALHFHHSRCTVDFDIGALNHELNPCLDLLGGVLQDCPLLQSPSLCIAPCCFASALHLMRLQNMSAQPS